MTKHTQFSRRRFVQGIGYATALSSWRGVVPLAGALSSGAQLRYAYVGSTSNGKHGLYTFAVEGNRWEQVQFLSSPSPFHLVLHPSRNLLYVSNEISEHEGLPAGTIESYSVDPDKGTLTLLHTQRLSLSAVGPRRFALSPDSRYLVVAVYGGGAYNLLPLGDDGLPKGVSGILKEIGQGNCRLQLSANPSSLCFDPVNGHVLSADLGANRLNVLAVWNGRFVRKQQLSVAEGAGPGQVALHPSRNFLYVTNDLEGTISCYRYSSHSGWIEDRIDQVEGTSCDRNVDEVFQSSLGVHHSGRFLYSSFWMDSRNEERKSIRAWKVDPYSGELMHISDLEGQMAVLTPSEDKLYVLDQRTSSVSAYVIDSTTGSPLRPNYLAQIESPKCIALKY